MQPGSEERGAGRGACDIERQEGNRGDEKIKNILFGSCEKILTFALPTETKGKQKNQMADVMSIIKQRLKRAETGRGRLRPIPN